MKLYKSKEAKEVREQSCDWCGFFFPANSSTHKFCSGTCKNAARNERARADRDAAAAHERWQTGELNNDELAAELIRVQYMPHCIALPIASDIANMTSTKVKKQVRVYYGIIKEKAIIWLQKRKEIIDARISASTSK